MVLNPTTGAIEAMYSNPTFDPNPLVLPERRPPSSSPGTPTWPSRGIPLVPGTYGQAYPPGSSFKVVTTSAVLQHRPDLATMTYPTVPFVTLPNTGTPAQVLTNYHSTLRAAGTSSSW